jgi:hypothetical protein
MAMTKDSAVIEAEAKVSVSAEGGREAVERGRALSVLKLLSSLGSSSSTSPVVLLFALLSAALGSLAGSTPPDSYARVLRPMSSLLELLPMLLRSQSSRVVCAASSMGLVLMSKLMPPGS